jgi:hypothetical protein
VTNAARWANEMETFFYTVIRMYQSAKRFQDLPLWLR